MTKEDVALIVASVEKMKTSDGAKQDARDDDQVEQDQDKTNLVKENTALKNELRDTYLSFLPNKIRKDHEKSSIEVIKALIEYIKKNPVSKGVELRPSQKTAGTTTVQQHIDGKGVIGGLNSKTDKWT